MSAQRKDTEYAFVSVTPHPMCETTLGYCVSANLEQASGFYSYNVHSGRVYNLYARSDQ